MLNLDNAPNKIREALRSVMLAIYLKTLKFLTWIVLDSLLNSQFYVKGTFTFIII
jgi:hypothetical protein